MITRLSTMKAQPMIYKIYKDREAGEGRLWCLVYPKFSAIENVKAGLWEGDTFQERWMSLTKGHQ